MIGLKSQVTYAIRNGRLRTSFAFCLCSFAFVRSKPKLTYSLVLCKCDCCLMSFERCVLRACLPAPSQPCRNKLISVSKHNRQGIGQESNNMDDPHFDHKSAKRFVDTVNTKAKQYQECETLITRIEVRIMRLRKGKG
jgi:hypothetical protein